MFRGKDADCAIVRAITGSSLEKMSGSQARGALEPPPGTWFSSTQAAAREPSQGQDSKVLEPRTRSLHHRDGSRSLKKEPMDAVPKRSRIPAENSGIGGIFFLSEGEMKHHQRWEAQRPILVKEFKQQRRDALRRQKRSNPNDVSDRDDNE